MTKQELKDSIALVVKNNPVTKLRGDVLKNKLNEIIDECYPTNGSSFQTKTKAEIDTLISTNALVVGTLYKITGVHDSTATLGALEDDGVINGITIYLRALTTNTLEKGGIGIFHSPIRDMSHWNSKVFQTWIKLDGSGSTLRPDETITADNGATGILKIGTDTYHSFVLIEPLTGDWTTAASFVGDTSAGSFTITSYTLPLGSTIGDKVLWGNYVWTNTTGTVGLPIDDRTLDSNWTKVAYNNTDYVTMYNYCEFDPTQNWITRRVDDKGNDVKFLFPIGYPFSGIAVFEWNNGVDFMNEYNGCVMNDLEFSYVVNCNMWKHTFNMNKLTFSQVRDNLGNNISISNNNIDMASVIQNNGNTISILYNNGVEIEVEGNKVSTMSVFHNIIVNSGIQSNIGNDYLLSNNTGSGYDLNDNSGNSISVTANKINYVNIHNNNSTSGFEFKNNNGVSCEIDGNNNTFNLSGTIENTFFEAPTVFNVDLSGATVIKSSYSKRVFKRPDDTLKIVHIDDTDTQVINDITD